MGTGLADGTPINFTFTVTWGAGQSQQFVYTQVVHTTVTISQLASSLQFGEILADQQRDFVYMIDKRFLRVLVFNTDVGAVVQAVKLGGLATVNGVPPAPGMMAESVDGSKLFVALPQSKIIQEFSLPDMTSLAQWSFNFAPESLACDALGRVYCTTNDSTQKLVQIDGTSGAVLTQSGPAFTTVYLSAVVPSILRRNAAGTELYGALSNQIYRFSTTGNGAPAALNTLTAGTGTVIDYALDEQAAQFYIASSPNILVVPLNGGATTSWSTNNSGCSAVSFLPGTIGVLTALNSFNGNYNGLGIRKYSKYTGTSLQDYSVTNTSNYEFTYRGLAATPNGRAVYVLANWSGSADDPSVDGYDYTVGMIGGSVSLDIPTGTPLALLSVAVTDPAPGSNDGYVHPGQTVQIGPVFKNFSSSTISNVSVNLTSSDPLGVVQAPATSTIGNVGGYVNFSPAANFKVAIGSAATDGYEIKLSLTVAYNNGTQQVFPYSLFVSNPIKAETAVNFAIGAMLSDRTRDLAYVIDNTNNRLLAIDTDLGVVSKAVNLDSSPGAGQMALSYDGTHLYLALTGAQQIQVFQLPALTQTDIINLNFQPVSLAAAADGRIYASDGSNSAHLYQIDPATGQTLGQFGQSTYYEPIIRTNQAGTSLYVVQLGLSGDGDVDRYAIPSSDLPTYAQGYPFLLSNTKDIEIDDSYNRIYSANGGEYGVVVTDMTTGTGGVLWPYNAAYSSAVCFLPQGPYVYGASYFGGIRRFNRADGTPLADFNYADGYETIDRDLVITANGRVLYGKSNGGSLYKLGLIGRSTLSVTPPTAAPAVYAGADVTVHLSQAAGLATTVTDTTSNLPVTWTMVSGPAGVSLNSTSSTSNGAVSASFSAPGTYQLSATATAGSLVGSDLINVTVLPDPPAVSVTATIPTAVGGGSTGQLVFSRTGTPTGALLVNYATSGTAQSGSDYVTLPDTVTIPDGAASVAVPVVALPNAGSRRTIVSQIATSSSYQVGVSQQATVTIVVPDNFTTFGSWSSSKLASYSAPLQKSDATLAHDGVTNLMKYALNLDPSQPASSGLPVVGISPPINSQNYLTLTFTQLQNATDLDYVVQVSSDLVNWSTDTAPVSLTPNGDGTATVVVRDAVALTAGAKRFIRLQVSQP